MSRICIATEFGNILVDIYEKQAPRTARHFLRYVDEGYYNGAAFYRSVRSQDNQPHNSVEIDVIEGGHYNAYYKQALEKDMIKGRPYDENKGRKGPYPPIRLEPTSETGIKHLDGVLSMGRTSPESVDDSFVFCMGDQPELDEGGRRHDDGLGFPAFGQAVEGQHVLKKIHAMKTEGQKIISEVRILSIARV